MNYNIGDVLFYYDGYKTNGEGLQVHPYNPTEGVKNKTFNRAKIRIIKPINETWTKTKRNKNIKFFEVEAIDNTEFENKNFMTIGHRFQPNSSTCFYSPEDYEESHLKSVRFWTLQAITEMQMIKEGKLKAKSFLEM